MRFVDWGFFLCGAFGFHYLPSSIKWLIIALTLLYKVFSALSAKLVPKFSNPVRTLNVIITGATSGLGLGLAHVFVKNGHNVVIISRTESKLKKALVDLEKTKSSSQLSKFRKITIDYVAVDLSSANASSVIERQLSSKPFNLSEVDVLVNNAASAEDLGKKNFDELDEEIVTRDVMVNVLCFTQLTHKVLVGMKARKFGKIMNVSTCVVHTPMPMGAAYFASKSYVTTFSRCLRLELAGRFPDIQILNYLPAGIKSRGVKGESLPVDAEVKELGSMSPLQCAEIGYNKLVNKGKIDSYDSGFGWVMKNFMIRFLPNFVFAKLIRMMMKDMTKAKEKALAETSKKD